MNYQAMKKADLIAHIKQLESHAPQGGTSLQVTSCQVFPFRCDLSMGKVKAMATIIINDTMQIRGLRVMDGENGLYVGYPVDPFFKGDEFRCVCFPITRAMREHIEAVVLEHYQKAIGTEVA